MRLFFLGMSILFSTFMYAQQKCATQLYTEEQKKAYPPLTDRINQIDAFIQKQRNKAYTNRESAYPVIKIPVVVHILYNQASQNVSDEKIKNLIEAMNRDFRRKNFDTANTPQSFKEVAADIQIEFSLATGDPKGRKTNGIIRRQTAVEYWTTDDRIKFTSQGGDDAWDGRYYFNIWVGNLKSVSGYSSVPGEVTEKDGVVIAYTTFGKSRILVHETGHWLGLKHIWGDFYCGDDLVEDTPRQGNFTVGCPNGSRSSCDNGTNGDMYMNYMDYTDDACMNLFTEGQKERMRSLFEKGGPRASLLNTMGLPENLAEESFSDGVSTKVNVYPNPAMKEIVLKLDGSWIGKEVHFIDAGSHLIQSIKITSKIQRININFLKAGTYLVYGQNGVLRLREKVIKL